MAEENVQSNVQRETICDLCENSYSEKDVPWYCNKCESYLCCNCQTDHQEGKPVAIFKKHQIVSWVDTLRSKLCGDEQCSKHAGDYLILHCNNCHQLVCNNCIIEEHNVHDFCEIKFAMESFHRDILQYSQAIESKLLTKCFEMESTITDIDKRCDDFYSTKERDFQKNREQLTGEVNRLCDGVLQTIAKEKKKSMSIIDQDKTAVQAKIQEFKTLLDEVMEKSNSEMIQFMKEKPTIADFVLPTVSPLQLPNFIDEQLKRFRIVKIFPGDSSPLTAWIKNNQ